MPLRCLYMHRCDIQAQNQLISNGICSRTTQHTTWNEDVITYAVRGIQTSDLKQTIMLYSYTFLSKQESGHCFSS
jgi:hypothetical protein